MNSYFGMATVCPGGYRPNKRYRAKRGQRQCIKGDPKKTLRELQAAAAANDVSTYKRRKDGMGFTRTPLTTKALKYRLTKMRVAYFGKAKYTMAQIAAEPNPIVQLAMTKGLKVRTKAKKITLKELQKLAKANDVSIYKRRKDNMGFTRIPLTTKALKYRLTKMKVPYK